MNLAILQPEIQQFISENLKNDLTKIILKGSPFSEVTIQELANQIAAKQKSEKKLPTWFHTENIYYPQKVSIEQTSSEVTAAYKTKLISGNSIIDITGGFGVDCYFFSKKFKKVTHCEINPELSEIVNHNYKQLHCNTIATISGDGIEYLKTSREHFDCIYIDPSRRNDAKGKVFLLKDCLPNVPENMDLLFEKSNQILIKNSPILDIKSTIKELKFVKEIHIVALNNEVKELLFLLERNYVGSIQIKTRNFTKNGIQQFDFDFGNPTTPTYSLPLSFLYEPNAAILKSGGFNEVSTIFNFDKLHQHSHLYTSKEINDFPGRKFKVLNIVSYDKKKISKLLTDNKANITTRNFPKTVLEIRKETKIKDGGNIYLFCTTDNSNNQIVIVCNQIF